MPPDFIWSLWQPMQYCFTIAVCASTVIPTGCGVAGRGEAEPGTAVAGAGAFAGGAVCPRCAMMTFAVTRRHKTSVAIARIRLFILRPRFLNHLLVDYFTKGTA